MKNILKPAAVFLLSAALLLACASCSPSGSKAKPAAVQFIQTFFQIGGEDIQVYNQLFKQQSQAGSLTDSLHKKFRTLTTADGYSGIVSGRTYLEFVKDAAQSGYTVSVRSASVGNEQESSGTVVYNFTAEVQLSYPNGRKKTAKPSGTVQLSLDKTWKVSYFKCDTPHLEKAE